MKSWIIRALCVVFLAGCVSEGTEVALDVPPTATLQPLYTQTPRSTATQVPTETPLPTETFTSTVTSVPPSPTLSPTPTLTPTVIGIVQTRSEAINVRSGPSIRSPAITSLRPGTDVLILQQSADGEWINIRMDDGDEGWVAEYLLFIPPSPTPLPSATPSPDLTALALGSPLPTAIFGGGTVTPTPPSAVRTATPAAVAQAASDTPIPTDNRIGGVPLVDSESIFQTATALAGSAGVVAAVPTQDGDQPDDADSPDPAATDDTGGRDEGTALAATNAPELPTATPTVDLETVNGVDVFAFCDDPRYSVPAPGIVRAGDYIDIWWGWFADTRQQVQDQIDAANYDLRVDGQRVENVNRWVSSITFSESAQQYVAYWYVPFGPMEAGTHEITYELTWERAITDGDFFYGPGTQNPFNQETCTFEVVDS